MLDVNAPQGECKQTASDFLSGLFSFLRDGESTASADVAPTTSGTADEVS